MFLKIERIKRGLTQKQLREILHFSPNKLVEIEKGNLDNIKVKDLRRIAAVFGLSVSELFPELSNKLELEV